MRKLSVYLIVDVSESMFVDAQRAVYKGIVQLLGELRRNSYALETVWISVITFARKAKVHVPLTELLAFSMPDLELQSRTALGATLRLLKKRIEKEVQPATAETKGNWRSLVFFLIDGVPTDNWRKALAEFKKTRPRPARVCAIACGEDVDLQTLREIDDNVFRLVRDCQAELSDLIANLFVWLSASVASASAGLDNDDLSAVPPPKGIRLLKEDDEFDTDPLFPKCFYFHSIYSRDSKKFLTWYTFDGVRYNLTQVFPCPLGSPMNWVNTRRTFLQSPLNSSKRFRPVLTAATSRTFTALFAESFFARRNLVPLIVQDEEPGLIPKPQGSSDGFQITEDSVDAFLLFSCLSFTKLTRKRSLEKVYEYARK